VNYCFGWSCCGGDDDDDDDATRGWSQNLFLLGLFLHPGTVLPQCFQPPGIQTQRLLHSILVHDDDGDDGVIDCSSWSYFDGDDDDDGAIFQTGKFLVP